MTLPPPVFASVPPPADGLRLAFGAARRRRNGKAAVAGGAGVLVVSFLLSLGGAAGNQTLLQEPLPPARGGGVPVLGGTAPSPAPEPTRRPTDAVVTALATDPGAPRAAAAHLRTAPDGTATRSVRAASTRSTRAGAAASVSGPMTRDNVITVPGDVTCPIRKQSERSAGLCTEVWAYDSADGVSLEASLCSTEPGDVRLTYEDAKELDVAVLVKDREVWRWSVGRHFPPAPHALVLQAGDCFTWRTLWRVVDQSGRALPTGTYTIRADFFAAQVSKVERVAEADYYRRS